MTIARHAFRFLGLGLLTSTLGACGDSPDEPVSATSDTPPNVLFVVWDTTRFDRLGIYGAERDTTPFLDKYAERGLVFEDCRSVAPSTVPSHGSMFTGLWPSQHGANHKNLWLDDRHITLAEHLLDIGFDTYSFSANPNITAMENFGQGFATEEHLWDEVWREAATADLLEHYQIDSNGRPLDNQTGMAKRLREGALEDYEIKGCGALLNQGLGDWLDREGRDPERPWFAFLNYMEAHYPLQPAAEFRERLMDEEQLLESYMVNRSWGLVWRHVFGIELMPAPTVALLDITYDAAIAEMDALFGALVEDLEARGELENTLVILTSDHGENLGEHGLLDHRYSLSEELLRVPLVIWGSENRLAVTPGRTDYPAMTIDLFQTILVATGQREDASLETGGDLIAIVDLLAAGEGPAPQGERKRFADFPNDFEIPGVVLESADKTWDPRKFSRRLFSVTQGDFKLVRSGEQGEPLGLFDLALDPGCETNLATTDLVTVRRLLETLFPFAVLPSYEVNKDGEMSADEQERLGAIGYGE